MKREIRDSVVREIGSFRDAGSELQNAPELASKIVDDQIEDATRKHSDGTSISDVLARVDGPADTLGDALDLAGSVLGGVVDAGGAALEGIAQVRGAVAEHAGTVAEAAVDAVGAVIGGPLNS